MAEEFLRETFVRAMRQGAGVPVGPGLRSYLFTTAHHLVISERRRVRPRPFADLSEAERATVSGSRAAETPSPERVLDIEKVRARLEAALDTLGPDHRLAFQAAVFEQRPYAEIARARGWTVEQVKVNVHRARKKVVVLLRDLVRPEQESP
jgi:RNA polymerase sigma-70 factor (ECF subfamily)